MPACKSLLNYATFGRKAWQQLHSVLRSSSKGTISATVCTTTDKHSCLYRSVKQHGYVKSCVFAFVFGVSSKTPTILATATRACPAFSSTPYGQPLGVNSVSRCSFYLYVSLFHIF